MHRLLLPSLMGGLLLVFSSTFALAAGAPFTVSFGSSWDGVSLQSILDAEYGPGVLDVNTGYEGFLAGDADPAYWEDLGIDGLIIREVAGNADRNTMGWYREDLGSMPVIDGVDDGVIFVGPMVAGATATVNFPAGVTRFGLYLDPNGDQGAVNAPQPETFFTNRSYNDLGPDGSGALHEPFDGDVQCLVFNITDQRNGVPTFVVAWEDLDSGAEITPGVTNYGTDNDYQDLVVEIQADSPVPTESMSFSRVKALYRNH